MHLIKFQHINLPKLLFMACNKVKEDKQKLKEDPYKDDARYMALTADVRALFHTYLSKNTNGSLTDFLNKRKKISDKQNEKNSKINGKRIIERTDGGSIQTRIMNENGEID